MGDRFRVSILKDGTMRVENDDGISAANHGNAEMMIDSIINRMGGDVERVEKGTHTHMHEEGIYHEH